MKNNTALLVILLLLFPLLAPAQAWKKVFKTKSPNQKTLELTIARKAEQARKNASVFSPTGKKTDYTKTVIPNVGTLHSFAVLPPLHRYG